MRRAARGVVVDCAELTDPGQDPTKQINEDSCALVTTPLGVLAVVCDGMGGHSAGREASVTGVRTIIDQLAQSSGPPGAALKSALEHAATAVYAVGGSSPPELRPGSTCVSLLLHEGGAHVAHVGDSRAYLLRGSRITRLTRDHSMVQQMIDARLLTDAEAVDHPEANKITRALGMTPTVEVELSEAPVRLLPGDVLLLCSDGLTDLVSDDEIGTLCRTHAPNGPEHMCQVLVNVANARGGWDNITAVALIVVELPRSASDTVVLEGDANTLVDSPAPGATLVDAEPRPGAGDTMLDEPRLERTTLPGDAPPTRTVNFLDDPLPHSAPVPARAKTVLWLGAVLSVVILSTIIVWALVRAVRKAPDDVPPPLQAPSAEPAIPTMPEVTLETPETMERRRKRRPRDAGADADSGPE